MVWLPCSIQGSSQLSYHGVIWGLNCGLTLSAYSLDPLSLLPPLLRITLKPPSWWSLSQSASSEIRGRKPYIEFCTKAMLFLLTSIITYSQKRHRPSKSLSAVLLQVNSQKVRYQANALLFEASTFWIIFDNGPIPFLALLFQLNRSLWSHVILNHNSC